MHVKNALFFPVIRGIQRFIDPRNLPAPASAAPVVDGQHLVLPPVEVVGDECHLVVEILLGVES